MHGLIEGRKIHFVDVDGNHRSAEIVLIHAAAAPVINAWVAPRYQREEGFVAEKVQYAKPEKNEPNSWHWIERVE